MSLGAWFRPPRQLIALFLLTTLIPAALLIAFGWRLLLQDRALEMQRMNDQREQAADLAVAALEQQLARSEQRLRGAGIEEAAAQPDGAVRLVFERDRVEAFPPRLLYYPVATPGREAPAATFSSGEDLEYRQQNLERAAASYRQLTASPDAAVRAGAWIRLGRTLRKRHEDEAALAAYAELSKLEDAAVNGVPADLMARWARCDLLAAAGRRADLEREAQALSSDLMRSRWKVTRATYDLHVMDAMRWLGHATTESRTEREPIAAAVDALWTKWQQMRSEPSSQHHPATGRERFAVNDASVVALWQVEADRLRALIAGPAFVEREWLARLGPLMDRHHVRVALRDRITRTPNAPESWRAAADTGLPWTVMVQSVDAPGEQSLLAGRRALWFAALAILAALVLTGAFFVSRAVTRELAVARRQSDFVAAVSHEFRTPLTSLRQLTEVLGDGRVVSDERRQAYYAALGRQTTRLHRLVEGLLDFGRMEAGRAPYRAEPLDVGALVRSTVDQFSLETAGTGHTIELHLNGSAPLVRGDRDALTNAIWNLLDNAVKYSPGSPTVWVDVAKRGPRVEIAVRDQGYGIPRHEQREIFGKFVRGATAMAENIKGTGIGLAMVGHIMDAHDGDVKVASEPGAGSTFTLSLPLSAEASQS